jgi:hypothetical protein
MLLPLILIVLALLLAAVLAYGTEPLWASLSPHGLDLIIWSRWLEWPLIVATLLLCGGLFVVIISGKRRIWWLIGLLPILALFLHRFTAGPTHGMSAVADPPFVAADKLPSLPADDLVVGLIVNEQPLAFPCSELYRAPVIVRTGREKPIVLMWSVYANRALAFYADRDFRAQDLEIVSMPDNALLIYNSRLGQFINAVTGKTTSGQTPIGLHELLPIVKTTWASWRSAHADTQVMSLPAERGSFAQPLSPPYKMPGADLTRSRRICLIATTQPIAVPSEAISDKPLNLSTRNNALLLVKVAGAVRCFNRELPGDLVPRFFPFTDPKHPAVAWTGSDTASEWNTRGEWTLGPKEMHGTALAPVPVEDDLNLSVMHFWYPNLHLASDDELKTAAEGPTVKPPEKAAGKKRKLRGKG